MKFNTEVEDKPQSEREFKPFPAGDYEFVVDAAEDAISKTSGNPMIKLTLHIVNDEGHKRVLFEYLPDHVSWKIKQFCESCGMLDRFNSGELEPYELVGKTGRAKIVIESSVGFDDKNKVAAYIKAPGAAAPARKPAKGDDLDDAIPF